MANIRISQLPSAQTAITGNELVPIVQNGETVQTTISAIVNSPVQTQTFLTKNNEPTLPNSRYLAVGAGLSLADGGAQSTYSITPVGALASLVSAGQGFMVKSSGTSLVNRSIAISGNGLSIINGDGTTGNPTISLINNVANLAGASGTGLLAIAGNNSLSTVTIAGTSNQISVTNGNTSPVIGIASNPIFPGTASITLPSGGTSARPSGINGMLRYNSDLNALETYANGAWGTIVSGTGVSSFSAGTTGLTPSSGTTGAVVLSGTLNASNGGTGVAGTLTGIPYANGTSAYTTATTAQLLTLLGTTPIANGGTGQTTASAGFNALSPITTVGDLIYGSATNTSSRLPIGTTNQVLTVVGGIPAWGSVAGVAVTSFSAGSTGLSPAAPTSGAVTLSGTLAVANGGTGLSSTPANGQLLIGNGSSYTLATLTAGAGISVTNASGAITIAVNGTGEVISFSGGTTGLTPSTATGGAIVLGGTLVASNGGSGTSGTLTGILYGNGTSAYTTATTAQVLSLIGTLPIANGGTGINTAATPGAIVYGSTTTALAYTSAGSSGQVLVSGGAGAPTWSTLSSVAVTTFSGGTTGLTPNTATSGAITLAGTLATTNGGTGLTSFTSGGAVYATSTSALTTGTLPVTAGGTGLTSLTAGYIPYGNGTSALASNSGFTFTGTALQAPTLAVTSTVNTTPNLTFNASNSSITSGASVSGNYLQTVIQNKSGTAGASTNYVLSNDLGTDSTYYGEFGMNSSVFSSGTPSDFYSINNGIYFSGHDGDITLGSGNGFKTYIAWGSTGQSAHVINSSGAIGLNTNLGATPATTGTTNFGTAGQVMISAGSSATPVWGNVSGGTF